MALGTELMAALPTLWSKPGLVTRPTPKPPSMSTPGDAFKATLAKISAPAVTSGSSPASLAMAQDTKSAPRVISSTCSVRSIPLGVCSPMDFFSRPVSSIQPAALAAAAAQEPVV